MLFRLLRPVQICRLYATKCTHIPAVLTIKYNSNNYQQRTYKNFGHKEKDTPFASKLWFSLLLVLFVAPNLNYKWIYRKVFPSVDAHSESSEGHKLKSSESKFEGDGGSKKPKKEKIGFRDRKIIDYENRLRAYSTPDKIFRYFATVKIITQQGTEILMTPDDFLRSITPGLQQPEGKNNKFHSATIIEYENRIRQYSTPDKVFRYFATLQLQGSPSDQHEIYMTPEDFLRSITPGSKQPDGLGLDQFKKYDPKFLTASLHKTFIYLHYVCIASRRHFEIAFRMFDLNGDGDVDCEEFEKVATLVRHQTSIGSRHRDHANTGNTFKGVNSALTTYFFGPNLKQKLTIEKFLDFQEQLQKEILSLEFQRKNPDEDGKISETDFTELLFSIRWISR
ncbi:ef hand domain family a1a2-related [Holotrichia oblita]|uniref:Ef hand domain family a1a2-related n=1 Tax=Holotrichia oblita TaxID=644536 RepID=A0ACB9TGA8_HOLOL|nr:ef hand domain family a1a2-related [Holotrichia oblita]